MPFATSVLLASSLISLVVGCLLGWLSQRGRVAAQQRSIDEAVAENRRLQSEGAKASISASASEATAKSERQHADQLKEERNRLAAEKEAAEKRATAAQTQLAEESKQAERLKSDRESLRDQFEALAGKILEEKAKTFTEQNDTNIGRLLNPLHSSLKDIDEKTRQLEEKREGAYREVLNEIKNVKETHDRLRLETTQLVQALRTPRVRGNWGELQLKKCVEFAGMVEHASFDVQVSVVSGEDRLRPDCVIHLPNQRTIVIDAKTPFDAFLDAMAATDETIRAMKMAAHGERVRQHLNDLSSKAYWRQFRDSPDFVVCFLSAEVLFSAALEQDPSLIEHGANSKVILATPTTLIALLKAVAYGWQQMDITRNAIDIRKAGQDLYNKLAVAHEHFLNMGKAITSSVRHYNSLVGSVEGRGSVFSLARNMGAMGVGQIEIADLPPIELATRDLEADDWIPGLLPGTQENED
jgi:DNA recombination protein RmuC